MGHPFLRIFLAFSLLTGVFNLLSITAPGAQPNAAAAPIGTAIFQRTWSRTDQPVAELRVSRTWMWGPEAHTGVLTEPYVEAPGGQRTVQYFDKSRMEDNAHRASPPWDVTNGLLAKELITGRMQLGDNQFESRAPAQVHVAGDPDPNAPTYATFNALMGSQPLSQGTTVLQTVDATGAVGDDPSLASYGVTAAYHVADTNHTVASVFWDFMNSSGLVYENGQYINAPLAKNPFYAVGFPLTEAYWTTVRVGGVPTRVLVQVFERRVLTYTPDNPDGWQVEAGNVGQHYYRWRHDTRPIAPAPDPCEPGRVLYAADWSSGTLGWTSAGQGAWQSVGGTLLFDGSGASTMVASYDVPTTCQYAVEATIQSLRHDSYNTHSGFGIIIRATGPYSLYPDLTDKEAILAGVHRKETGLADSYSYAAIRTGSVYPEFLAFSGFDPGQDWHTYRVEVRGNTITLLVDGQMATQTTSNLYLSGTKVGLFSVYDELSVQDFRVIALD